MACHKCCHKSSGVRATSGRSHRRKASRAAGSRLGRSPVVDLSQAIDCRRKVKKVPISCATRVDPPPPWLGSRVRDGGPRLRLGPVACHAGAVRITKLKQATGGSTMAEQTTKQAAVWNPPRLRALGLGVDTGNDGGRGGPHTDTWESNCPVAAPNYRMPTSGETGTFPPACTPPPRRYVRLVCQMGSKQASTSCVWMASTRFLPASARRSRARMLAIGLRSWGRATLRAGWR